MTTTASELLGPEVCGTHVWKQITRIHEANELGVVRNIKTKHILKQRVGTNGRPCFGMKVDGKVRQQYVHVLVCTAFHGPRPEGMWVSHLNGDKLDNRASNLAWETPSENMKRKREHGTLDIGFNNSRAAFTPEDIQQIFSLKENGVTQTKIARKFSVSDALISLVLNGKRYDIPQ